MYAVSGVPAGVRIVNEMLVGRPGRIAPTGPNPDSAYVLAAPTFGAVTLPPELEPQPATAEAAAGAAI